MKLATGDLFLGAPVLPVVLTKHKNTQKAPDAKNKWEPIAPVQEICFL